MHEMIDDALAKTRETAVKTRHCSRVNIESELLEQYNNGFIDIPHLQKLNKLVKDATYELRRQHKFKMEAIDESLRLKKILDSVVQHREHGSPCAIYDSKRQAHFNEESVFYRFCNRIEYFFNVHMSPILLLIVAFVFCILTAVVIFFEFSLYFSWDTNNGIYAAWVSFSSENKESSFFLANLICILPLTYICSASYFGLFKIKVQSVYALHSGQQTDPPCLVFSGMLLMRLASAVAYNFLELSRVKDCAFFQVMGPLVKIQFLGEGFNKWIFPTLLLLTIFLTVFDVIGRVLNCVGLRQYAFDEDYAEERVIEGKQVIERYLKNKSQVEQEELEE